MDDTHEVSLNLGNIQTQWSILRQAHADDASQDGEAARRTLVMRYASAIRHFVQLVVRNEVMADELAQDAIVRLLNGDFAGADPQRGRFRDLLKTALRNMARNHWAKEKYRTGADVDLELVGDSEEQELDEAWSRQWREHLLALAWDRLRAWEADHENSVAYQVLKLRAEYPKDSSNQLAARLSSQSSREFNAQATRQQLRRARVRFVEFLIEEIADGLPDPTPEHLQGELIALGLFASVKDVLPEEWQ